jgi:hypothetical protein
MANNSLATELKKLLRSMNDRDIQQIDSAIKAEIAQRVAKTRQDPEVAWAKAVSQ